ncbi:MAG: hypothetical protein FWG91_03725 [Lachnospiraceae bacterium]|nr:hypothetical protein [Lachnospiraceae bacterium]
MNAMREKNDSTDFWFPLIFGMLIGISVLISLTSLRSGGANTRPETGATAQALIAAGMDAPERPPRHEESFPNSLPKEAFTIMRGFAGTFMGLTVFFTLLLIFNGRLLLINVPKRVMWGCAAAAMFLTVVLILLSINDKPL